MHNNSQAQIEISKNRIKLQNLLLIIITGILLGSLIMRFLIFPALRHDEKP